MEPFDQRVAHVALLDQPLRRALYDLLSPDGWLGRDDAADALSMPRSVVAFHLDKLADAGLAEVRYERPAGRGGPGAGRPAKRYRRSPKELAVTVPPRQYDLAARVLADTVAETAATGRPVADVLAETARRTGTELGADQAATRPRRSRTGIRRDLLAALGRLGYAPRETRGEVVLVNCPFHALAERHRALVCGVNLDLLTGFAAELDDSVRPVLEPAAGFCCVRLRT